jgi:hypothetical protein
MLVWARAKWGMSLTGRVAMANFLVGLGSLPPRDTVFTHYSKNAAPLRFLQFEHVMKTELQAHLHGRLAV